MRKSYEEFFFFFSLNIVKDFSQKPDDDLAFKQSNKFKEKTEKKSTNLEVKY